MTEPRIEIQDQAEITGSRAVMDSIYPDTPRIYMACLAAYVSGYLHGAWIEVADEGRIWKAVQHILKTSPVSDAEEWAIHDYEGFEGVEINEYDSFARVVEIAQFLENCPTYGSKLLEHFSGDIQDAEAALERYSGEYETLADFAQELTESTTPIPETLQYYIDYKSMARDMEMSGDVFVIKAGYREIHVFFGAT